MQCAVAHPAAAAVPPFSRSLQHHTPTALLLLTFITLSRLGTVQSSLPRPAFGSVMTLHANCSPVSRCVATRTVE